jgi:hypothetical protein
MAHCETRCKGEQGENIAGGGVEGREKLSADNGG